MSVKEKLYDRCMVLSISGNMMGGPETRYVHEKVKTTLESGIHRIVIDLSGVSWVNSSGLGTLLACLSSAKSSQGELKMCGAQEKVKSMLMLTKLMTLFDSYDTIEEAVSAF